MIDYSYRITDDRPPVAEVFLRCAFGDCKAEFHLPLADIPIPVAAWDQPRISMIDDLAVEAGWSRDELDRPRCPAHPGGQALGLPELEADAERLRRSRQALINTGTFQAVTGDETELYLTDLCKAGEGYRHRQCTGCECRCHGGGLTATEAQAFDVDAVTAALEEGDREND